VGIEVDAAVVVEGAVLEGQEEVVLGDGEAEYLEGVN